MVFEADVTFDKRIRRREWNYMLSFVSNRSKPSNKNELVVISSWDACEQYGIVYDGQSKQTTVYDGISKTNKGVTLEFGKGSTLELLAQRSISSQVYFEGNTPYKVKVTISRNTSYIYSMFSDCGLSLPYDQGSNTIPPLYSNREDEDKNDLSDMVKHIKECIGGNWQSDTNQHWKICGTCGLI